MTFPLDNALPVVCLVLSLVMLFLTILGEFPLLLIPRLTNKQRFCLSVVGVIVLIIALLSFYYVEKTRPDQCSDKIKSLTAKTDLLKGGNDSLVAIVDSLKRKNDSLTDPLIIVYPSYEWGAVNQKLIPILTNSYEDFTKRFETSYRRIDIVQPSAGVYMQLRNKFSDELSHFIQYNYTPKATVGHPVDTTENYMYHAALIMSRKFQNDNKFNKLYSNLLLLDESKRFEALHEFIRKNLKSEKEKKTFIRNHILFVDPLSLSGFYVPMTSLDLYSDNIHGNIEIKCSYNHNKSADFFEKTEQSIIIAISLNKISKDQKNHFISRKDIFIPIPIVIPQGAVCVREDIHEDHHAILKNYLGYDNIRAIDSLEAKFYNEFYSKYIEPIDLAQRNETITLVITPLQ